MVAEVLYRTHRLGAKDQFILAIPKRSPDSRPTILMEVCILRELPRPELVRRR
jgi:hypothetical protein